MLKIAVLQKAKIISLHTTLKISWLGQNIAMPSYYVLCPLNHGGDMQLLLGRICISLSKHGVGGNRLLCSNGLLSFKEQQ